MKLLLLLALLALFTKSAHAQNGFVDHGVGAKVAENRGVVTTVTKDGRHLVICQALDVGPRGFLVVTDLDSGRTKQCFCPEGIPQAAPFGALMSSNGRFYTTQGKWLLEFDPNTGEWTFQGVPTNDVGAYLCFTQGPDGVVWTGGANRTSLVSFDPATREMKDHGVLDPKEEYLSFLAVDKSGWVYAGIGTARCNLVAYNPRTGERRQLVKEETRGHGTGTVYPLTDGTVSGEAAGQSYRLLEGHAAPLDKSAVAPRLQVGDIHYGGRLADFPDGRRLVFYDLPGRLLKVDDPKTKQTKSLEFDYETEGADLTSLAAGPNGVVYASSCHPMHLIALDTTTKELKDLGYVPQIGGGNFCAMARQGGLLIGAEYAGGRLWAYDPAKPWDPSSEEAPNPAVLAQWKDDLCRPRTALAHPDGKHVMMAGFAGYGLCGGGLGLYNLETKEATLLAAEKDLLPGHSCITLKCLPNGDLVGGTSISAPGGGHQTAKEAELFLLDWEAKKITFHTVPVPGDGNVVSLEAPQDGLVYGLSGNSTFFVFDPNAKRIVHSESYGAYGGVPRHALQLGPDGKLYALLSKAILRITPGTFEHEKLTDTPVGITAGGALTNGLLCFAGRSHVWTYQVPDASRRPAE
jgi:streptogramin lyase